jgi:hypothetical protein
MLSPNQQEELSKTGTYMRKNAFGTTVLISGDFDTLVISLKP